MDEDEQHRLVVRQTEGVLILYCDSCHVMVENLGFEATPLQINTSGLYHYKTTLGEEVDLDLVGDDDG